MPTPTQVPTPDRANWPEDPYQEAAAILFPSGGLRFSLLEERSCAKHFTWAVLTLEDQGVPLTLENVVQAASGWRVPVLRVRYVIKMWNDSDPTARARILAPLRWLAADPHRSYGGWLKGE